MSDSMKYTEEGDTIRLEMSRDDYEQLLLLVGMAAGAETDVSQFWRQIDFVNRLNTGNPRFHQYTIPEEFRPAPGGKA